MMRQPRSPIFTSSDVLPEIEAAVKRVLVLTSTFPRWEGDTDPPFVHTLSDYLSNDFDIHVLAPHCEGAKVEERSGTLRVFRYRYGPERFERLAYDGGITTKLKKNPLYYLLVPTFLLAQIWAARRLNKQFRYDLIHAHWIIPQGIVATMIGVPYVVTSHGADLYAMSGGVFEWLKRKCLMTSAGITVVSHAMVTQVRRLGVDSVNVQVASMGVDVDNVFTPPQERRRRGSLKIVFVGRLVEKKGLPVLLNAVSRLKRDGTSVELVVVGAGPERPHLERLVSYLSIRESVDFVGALPNHEIPDYYRTADVAVFPFVKARDGDQEGLGLVSVEAMACGCVVVASRLPAVEDVVTDGEDGLLFKPGDAEELVGKLKVLDSDEVFWRRLSENSVASATRFGWGRVAVRYKGVYEAAIS